MAVAWLAFTSSAVAQQPPSLPTTAWDGLSFQVDTANVISRSDIVQARPNLDAGEAMPLGNGSLGVAVWSADGLTAQLNRSDTLPDRLSPGQVVIPGLAALTHAKDYRGRLDLYNGEFREQGGGMTVTAFVEPDTDMLIVDVTGADPSQTQTALLRLWAPRTPHAFAEGGVGTLAQSWVDDKNPESSGRTFGSLAAIGADGLDVSAAVTDPLTVTVSFRPFADGHFRIKAWSPAFPTLASRMPAMPSDDAHRAWWHTFWLRGAAIKVTSQDGAGEYMENLRNLYLYVAAIEKGTEFPGSQAGIADMISSARDTHRWDASAFWHWNLRMQVAANIGAGHAELNEPYFNLYRENLSSIESWTRQHMKGLAGSCVPETMRFNGRGIEYESTWTPVAMGLNCDAGFKPYYNARTLTTGAEVSLWVWQQYLATNDRKFLEENYPLMASAARFLLASQKPGADGLLHTGPSNAHETQWDVTDPTTDIAAILALYPATMEAATLLGRDADLVRQLKTALTKVPPLPRRQATGPRKLLPPSADAEGADVIAESYQPTAEEHNIENIGLEPVWPYGVIGDTSPQFALAQRTYAHRPFPVAVDWSFDPIQAARLGLGGEVASTLIAITQRFQHCPNGMAKWEPSATEFYVEQAGVVADALEEALVQDYDGTIRIAPAIPAGWDFDGSVYVRGNTRVDVQTRSGRVTTLVIESGSAQRLRIRNPWPGEPVEVIAGDALIPAVQGPVIEFQTWAGASFSLINRKELTHPFAPVSGAPASVPKKLGPAQIGLSGQVSLPVGTKLEE